MRRPFCPAEFAIEVGKLQSLRLKVTLDPGLGTIAW